MRTRRQTRTVLSVILGLFAATVFGIGSVAAHSQTVDPNGNGAGFTKPISKPWAQAHCNAAAPGIVYDASNGVVAFNPPTVLC